MGNGDTLENRARALEALANVSTTQMMTLDLDPLELDDPDPSRAMGALVRWMANKGDWVNRARFFPDGQDETEDLVRLRIAATLTVLFRNHPGSMIDYWIRICTIREKIDRGELQTTNLPFLLTHLRADAGEKPVGLIGRLVAWDQAQGRQVARRVSLSGVIVPANDVNRRTAQYILYGIVPIEDFKRRAFDIATKQNPESRDSILNLLPPPLKGFHGALMSHDWPYTSRLRNETVFVRSFANSIQTLGRSLDYNGSMVAMLPTDSVASGQGADSGFYSIYRLIALLGELLGLINLPATERLTSVNRIVTAFSAQRSFPLPALSRASVQEGADENPFEDGGVLSHLDADLKEAPGAPAKVVVQILDWLASHEDMKDDLVIPPLVLGRAWTRFEYTYQNILDSLSLVRTRYVGVLLHRTVVAFLHAVGAELCRSLNHEVSRASMNNPVTSGENFVALLEDLESMGANDLRLKRLFSIFFTFPVWGYFLARSDADIQEVDEDAPDFAKKIFDAYINQIGQVLRPLSTGQVDHLRTGEASKDMLWGDFTVEYFHPRQEAGAPTERIVFDGLFFPLNTVPMQTSQIIPKVSNARGTDLSKRLDAIVEAHEDPTSRRRRPRRRQPPDAEGPGGGSPPAADPSE
jgi:hypothetical protein